MTAARASEVLSNYRWCKEAIRTKGCYAIDCATCEYNYKEDEYWEAIDLAIRELDWATMFDEETENGK